MSEREARLEALLRRVLEWTPSFPVESGLLDEIAAALQDEPSREPQRTDFVTCGVPDNAAYEAAITAWRALNRT